MASLLSHISGAASVRTARGLFLVDRLLVPRREEQTPPSQIERVLVAIPHWRPTGLSTDAKTSGTVDQRTSRLLECINSLLGLGGTETNIFVFTNSPTLTTEHLSERSGAEVRLGAGPNLLADRNSATGITVVPWRPGRVYRHGFGLAWAHKALFKEALAVPEISHMVYLEDDMIFGRENLEYWLHGRTALASTGLIPGFVRYETSGGERWLTDLKTPTGKPTQVVTSRDGRSWISMVNPYQALYVLDRPLAIDHFRRSPSRSRIRSRLRPHDDLASASHGPIYDDPPQGLSWRSVVPLNDETIDPAALIEHSSANYVNDPTTDLATVRISEVFHD
jgi:hypothetical protein